MQIFSHRNGLDTSNVKFEFASQAMKQRVFAAFCKEEFNSYETYEWTDYCCYIDDVMLKLGSKYNFPHNEVVKKENVVALQRYIFDSQEWYVVFDFLELYIAAIGKDRSMKMETEFNHILEEETSAYRIREGLVVPITSETEFETIKEAYSTPFDSVNTHVEKSLDFFLIERCLIMRIPSRNQLAQSRLSAVLSRA